MTIRDYIRRRVVIGYSLVFLGIALVVATASFFTGDRDGPTPAVLIGFIPFFAAVVYMHFALRCPRCKGNFLLTPALQGIFSKKHRFNYCPYCGVSVDEKL